MRVIIALVALSCLAAIASASGCTTEFELVASKVQAQAGTIAVTTNADGSVNVRVTTNETGNLWKCYIRELHIGFSSSTDKSQLCENLTPGKCGTVIEGLQSTDYTALIPADQVKTFSDATCSRKTALFVHAALTCFGGSGKYDTAPTATINGIPNLDNGRWFEYVIACLDCPDSCTHTCPEGFKVNDNCDGCVCLPRTCQEGQIFNTATCSCDCSHVTTTCPEKYVRNQLTCGCECANAHEMPPNRELNEQCEWVCPAHMFATDPKYCPGIKVLNTATCSCQCPSDMPPCEPGVQRDANCLCEGGVTNPPTGCPNSGAMAQVIDWTGNVGPLTSNGNDESKCACL